MITLRDNGSPFAGSGFAARVVIFDLDGTLVDSAPDIADAVDRTLLDLDLPAAGEAKVRAWVGNGAAKLLERALCDGGGDVTGDAGRAMELFLRHYGESLCERSRLYDGVAQALAQLTMQKRRLALCTNKPSPMVRPLLLHFGIADCFAACIGGDDLPQKKPHPAPLLHIAGILGVAASDCLMVGDSRNDVEAARAAGMPVVAVSYGYNHGADIRDSRPDAVIDAMAGLPRLLAASA